MLAFGDGEAATDLHKDRDNPSIELRRSRHPPWLVQRANFIELARQDAGDDNHGDLVEGSADEPLDVDRDVDQSEVDVGECGEGGVDAFDCHK